MDDIQKEVQLFDIILSDSGDIVIVIDHKAVINEKDNVCLPAIINSDGALSLSMPSGSKLIFKGISEHLLSEMQLLNGFLLAAANSHQDTPRKLWLCSAGNLL